MSVLNLQVSKWSDTCDIYSVKKSNLTNYRPYFQATYWMMRLFMAGEKCKMHKTIVPCKSYACHWLSVDQGVFVSTYTEINHFRPTGFIHQWRSIDHVTSYVTDKQTSWLVNVTFDWCRVMTSCSKLWPKTFLITFLRHVFCTVNTESSQLIHRNDLKVKCKYKRI